MKKVFMLLLLLIPFSTASAATSDKPIAGITVTIENADDSILDVIRDVPIPFIYQLHTYALCKDYGVDYDLALAVMSGESNGDIEAVNHNRNGSVDKGLMQINSCNYEWLTEELGITDFYDPYQNIECGVFMLADIMERHTDIHEILMSYNMGEGTVKKLNGKGIYSSSYSRNIVKKYNHIKDN